MGGCSSSDRSEMSVPPAGKECDEEFLRGVDVSCAPEE